MIIRTMGWKFFSISLMRLSQKNQKGEDLCHIKTEECVRRKGSQYVMSWEFDAKYFQMKGKGMVLPDEVQAFRSVKNCKLKKVQRDQVMAFTKPLLFNL